MRHLALFCGNSGDTSIQFSLRGEVMIGSQTKPRLLNSWKEIARYLGRGVRTVQRWEHNGLPVHRIGIGSRAPVWADVQDIDTWFQPSGPTRYAATILGRQFQALDESIRQHQMLVGKMVTLRQEQRDSQRRLVQTIRTIPRSRL